MTKYWLDKLTVESVEFEIPENCPECGEKVEEVRGWSYDSFKNYGVLEADGDVDWYDQKGGEGSYMVAIHCGSCGHELAATE
jgi:hypothetical protein